MDSNGGRAGTRTPDLLRVKQASVLQKGLLAGSGALHRVDVCDFPRKE